MTTKARLLLLAQWHAQIAQSCRWIKELYEEADGTDLRALLMHPPLEAQARGHETAAERCRTAAASVKILPVPAPAPTPPPLS